MAQAIADVLTTAGFRVQLDGGLESVAELAAALEGGKIDLGLMEEPLTQEPKLRMLMPLYPSVLHAVYNSELGTPDLAALLAADPIYAGPPSSLGHRLIRELATHYQVPGIGARLRDAPWVPAPGSPPLAYLIFGGILTPEARRGFVNYQLFSFTESNNASAEALALLYPNLRTFTLPAGIYPELTDRSVETLAVETLLVSSPSLDSEIVYAAVAALREQPQELEKTYALSRASFSRAIDHSIHTIALHDGAQRYIDKDEPALLERYAEVLALGVALLLAIGTAVTALLRSRRQRQKDRLDEYFMRLQGLRVKLYERTHLPHDDSEKPPTTLADIDADVAHLEGEVLQLLVEERLAVDAALVTFFLLSESVRKQVHKSV